MYVRKKYQFGEGKGKEKQKGCKKVLLLSCKVWTFLIPDYFFHFFTQWTYFP